MAVCYSSFIIWRDTDMDAWWERESIVKFQSPTSIFIVAPSGGGKTELTRQILEHADGMFKIPPSNIYCSTLSGRKSIQKCKTQSKTYTSIKVCHLWRN